MILILFLGTIAIIAICALLTFIPQPKVHVNEAARLRRLQHKILNDPKMKELSLKIQSDQEQERKLRSQSVRVALREEEERNNRRSNEETSKPYDVSIYPMFTDDN